MNALAHWRTDFENRLQQTRFRPETGEKAKWATGFNAFVRRFLSALLESQRWNADRGDDALFTIDQRVCREGGNLDDELWWTFWHQNTRYDYTLVVTPFLCEMLPYVAPANQPFLINYLMNVALGATSWHLEYGFTPSRTQGAYMNEQLGLDLHHAVETHGLPRFLMLADESLHEQTRAAALWAMGWFPNSEAQVRPALKRAVGNESSALERDCAQFGFSMLDRAKSQPTNLTRDDWDDPPDALEELENDLLMRLLTPLP